MLEIERKRTGPTQQPTMPKKQDIVITKTKIETIENEDGSTTLKRIPVKVNITKKVNETKKMIKNYTAEEKIAELEKIFTK